MNRLFVYCCLAAAPSWAYLITAKPSVASPAQVGDSIAWSVQASDSAAAGVRYRFRVREPGNAKFRILRDFSHESTFKWTPSEREGSYEIEIAAQDPVTGAIDVTVERYQIASRAASGPVVAATSNKLVFLYSAPPCAEGRQMSAVVTGPPGVRFETPAQPCRNGESVNFYVAGLRPESDYVVAGRIMGGDGAPAFIAPVRFRTEALPNSIPETRATLKPEGSANGVLFQNRVFGASTATDLDGNVIWYYPEVVPYLTRPERGGRFFALIEKHGAGDDAQILREVDLAGNVVWETNAARINEQLVRMGKHPITSFHHEARRLPSGDLLVLAGTERLMRDVQGPGDVAIIGDSILVLNEDLEVVWFWDAFDHLEVSRAALQDEKCVAGQGGCAVFRLPGSANDWLHGNSLSYTPDGNIIYSARHQDWVIKIHYGAGAGSGDVLWRLGEGGDFRMISDHPAPWFSHQHDANFVPCEKGQCLLVFDNNNLQAISDDNAHSRGQLYYLDETSYTAELLRNFDLGDYAFALGSAQLLPNGNYHFNVGWTPSGGSVALEIAPDGTVVRRLEADTQVYRSERMKDLYTPY